MDATPAPSPQICLHNVINEKINRWQLHENQLAVRTQKLFCRITHQTEAQDMKVKAFKTVCLWTFELKLYVPAAYFHDSEGVKVSSETHMKILGFHFSS